MFLVRLSEYALSLLTDFMCLAGVWDLTQLRAIELPVRGSVGVEGALVLHKAWDAKDVSGDTYQWYEVGTFTPTQPQGADPGRLRVFIGGVGNPTGDSFFNPKQPGLSSDAS